MNISIVTPYTNTPELMRNFLNITIPIVEKYNYELVLVKDDKCSIEMMNEIEELIKDKPNIKNITDKIVQGCSIVNNRGVDNASHELILFINNDVFLKDDTAELLKEKLLSDNQIGIVQALLLYPNTNLVQSTGHVFGEYFNTHALINRDYHDAIVQEEALRQGLTNACCMMKKATFYQFGGYDEKFYNAWEGLELSIRVGADGYKLVYYPTAVAYHIQGSSRERIFRNQSYQDAYFWLKSKPILKVDFHLLIMKQLMALNNFDINYDYHIINCSGYSFDQWQPLLDLLKGHNEQHIITIYNKNDRIKLEEKIALDILYSYPRVIYLTDNYSQIKGNRYVFSQKNSKNDIIIDISGNVIPVE